MSIRLLCSLRSARHCLPQAPASYRSFSVTRQRQAQEGANPHDLQERIQSTELFKKLAASPTALQAINEFRQVLQKEGFDLTKKPSAMQMMKLGFNPEIKEAGLRLKEALDKAGVDLTNRSIIGEMMDVMKDLPSKKD